MTEIWKPVVGYEKYYEVSNLGRVRSHKTEKILKPNTTRLGYQSVELFGDVGTGSKRLLIHRLVGMAFIPNPMEYPQINHKDENPSNNNVENLEWCTAKYNMNYGTRLARQLAHIDYSDPKRKEIARKNGRVTSRAVAQYSKDGKLIATYPSAKEAQRQTGADQSHLLECCHNKPLRHTAGGYVWKFI